MYKKIDTKILGTLTVHLHTTSRLFSWHFLLRCLLIQIHIHAYIHITAQQWRQRFHKYFSYTNIAYIHFLLFIAYIHSYIPTYIRRSAEHFADVSPARPVRQNQLREFSIFSIAPFQPPVLLVDAQYLIALETLSAPIHTHLTTAIVFYPVFMHSTQTLGRFKVRVCWKLLSHFSVLIFLIAHRVCRLNVFTVHTYIHMLHAYLRSWPVDKLADRLPLVSVLFMVSQQQRIFPRIPCARPTAAHSHSEIHTQVDSPARD